MGVPTLLRDAARHLALTHSDTAAMLIDAAHTIDTLVVEAGIERKGNEMLRKKNMRLLKKIERACVALEESIISSGNDSETNLHWVRKLKKATKAQ